jgi:hypothetical protein
MRDLASLNSGNCVILKVPENAQGQRVNAYAVVVGTTQSQVTTWINGVSQTNPVENIFPISLSPDILEDAGFVNSPTNEISHSYSLSRNHSDLELKVWKSNGNWYAEPMLMDSQSFGIKYLHQLQNLFSSLTGQELVISFRKAHA